MTDKGHIFISYARADGSDFASKLYDDLEARRMNAWLDIYDIDPGEDFYSSIEKGLRGASAVVVVLTPGAVISMQVKSEWNSALNMCLPVIPLLAISCDVPPNLSVLNWIDFRNEYDAGIAALRRRLTHLYQDHLAYLNEQLEGYQMAQKAAAEPERFQPKIDDLIAALARWKALFAAQQDAAQTKSPAANTGFDAGQLKDSAEVFVGREAELNRLNSYLSNALDGQLQICLMAGEAGTGKTTLIEEFARQSQTLNDELLFVTGNCNAQTGISDPYLPFRQILGMLTGDETRLVASAITNKNAQRLKGVFKTSGRALIEIAPELIGTLIPGAGILVALARMGAKERGLLKGLEVRAEQSQKKQTEIEQSQIFLQYSALLRDLAKAHPLVVILDDLQWVDNASNALFFHLTRELKDSRILLIGLYRPNDVAAGRNNERHPLEQTLNEIKRYYGNIFIDLDVATEHNGRAFVDVYVDREAYGLGNEFKEALYQHTKGHALFTTELLREMQESGDLIKNTDGYWREAPDLNWDDLPAKVEAVIEERIERLAEELRETLTIASVEGVDFTVQVVASIRELKERELLKQFSQELEKQHRLVRENGESKIGKNFIFRYSFSHALFHRYLYNSLGTGERRLLHQAVAEALEALYNGYKEQIAAQLAQHYTEAGNTEKVIEYSLIAANNRLRLGETQAALTTLQNVNDLYEQDQPQRPDLLMKMKYLLGECYFHLSDRVKAKEVLEEALRLNDQLNDPATKIDILFALSEACNILREKDKYSAYLHSAHELAESTGDEHRLAKSLRRMAIFYKSTRSVAEALVWYHQSLDLAIKNKNLLEQVETLNSLGMTYSGIGQLQKGLAFYDEAIQIAERESFIYQLGTILSNLAYRQRALGLFAESIEGYKKALEIAVRVGNRSQQKVRLHGLGKTFQWTGRFPEAENYFLQSIAIAHDLDSLGSKVDPYRDIAILYLQQGNLGAAEKYIDGAFSFIGEEPSQSWIVKGFIQLRQNNKRDAKVSLENALAVLQNVLLKRSPDSILSNFEVGIALAGLSLTTEDEDEAREFIDKAKMSVSKAISIAPYDKGAIKYRGIDMLDTIKSEDRNGLLVPLYTLSIDALAQES